MVIIKYFYKNGRYINIKKYFENINNEVTEECSVELIKNLCFLVIFLYLCTKII